MHLGWSYRKAAEVMTNDPKSSWFKLLWIVPKLSGDPKMGENVFVTWVVGLDSTFFSCFLDIFCVGGGLFWTFWRICC